MRLLRIQNLILASALLMTACGGDDDNNGTTPTPDPTPTKVTNNNANTATATNSYVTQLEFPHVKGGTSDVIVHSTSNYGMTYAVEWDHTKKAQRWTCYTLTSKTYTTNGNTRKSLWPDGDPWAYDPNVPQSEQSATYSELSKSYYPGTTDAYYEKGHVCPSADRIFAKDANEQTFYMTNILPMVAKFNGGIWGAMEQKVRDFAGQTAVNGSRTWGNNIDTLFICKGGTIDKTEQILGQTIGGHIVPKYFFMAVLAKIGGAYRPGLGFWVEHLNEDHSTDALSGYVVSIRELEQKTGIDFFCNLPDDVEEQVENVTTDAIRTAWGLK